MLATCSSNEITRGWTLSSVKCEMACDTWSGSVIRWLPTSVSNCREITKLTCSFTTKPKKINKLHFKCTIRLGINWMVLTGFNECLKRIDQIRLIVFQNTFKKHTIPKTQSNTMSTDFCIIEYQYKKCLFTTYLSACSLWVPLKLVSDANCVRNVLTETTIFFVRYVLKKISGERLMWNHKFGRLTMFRISCLFWWFFVVQARLLK